MQEIFSAAESDVFDAHPGCVGLLCGAKNKMRPGRRGAGRRLPAGQKVKRSDNDEHGHGRQDERKVKSTAVRLRRFGNLDLRRLVHQLTTEVSHVSRCAGYVAEITRSSSATHHP